MINYGPPTNIDNEYHHYITYVQKAVLQPPTQGRVVMWVGGMVISCKISFSSPKNHIKLFIIPLHSIIIIIDRISLFPHHIH